MQVSIIFYRGRRKIATVKNGTNWSVHRMRYNATQLGATRFVVRYHSAHFADVVVSRPGWTNVR